MSEFLVEAARHSAMIAASLHKLRQRAEAAIRDAAIADTVLDAREAARDGSLASRMQDGVQPRNHGPSTALDAPAIDLEKGWSANLLRDVAAPDAYTLNPLTELELLALRSAQALRKHHARLRQLSVMLGAVAAAVTGAGLYAVSQGESALAGGLLAGGVVVVAAVVVAWRPFRRASRSSELAELADATATTLRLRMRALAELPDHKTRQLEQWKVILDMTADVRRR